jgi:ferredoxin
MSKADPAPPVAVLQGPPRRRAQRPLPSIDIQRCTGCGRCVAACDPHLLSLEARGWEKSAVLHEAERCTGCHRCAVVCPFNAITMQV